MMLLAEPTADSATDTSRPPRHYLPEDFHVTDWATIEPFFMELRDRDITSAPELERWLLDRSELEAVLSEDLAWRYIRMTCDTQDGGRTEAFQYFVNEIEPHVAPYDHALNEKMMASPYLAGLDREPLRGVPALGAAGAGNLPGREHSAQNRNQHQAAAVRRHGGGHDRDPRRRGADPAPGRRPPQKPRPGRARNRLAGHSGPPHAGRQAARPALYRAGAACATRWP